MNTRASQVSWCLNRAASAWVVIGCLGAFISLALSLTGCTPPPPQLVRTGPAPVVTRKAPLMGLHFNVSMPGIATKEEVAKDDMTGYTSNVDGAVFVAYEQQTTDYDFSEDKKLIEGVLNGACDGFAKGASGKERKRVNIAKEDWPGKEVEGAMPKESGSDSIYRMRVFVDPVKGRTMYLGVFGPKKRLTESDVEEFFRSFSPPPQLDK
ncbi:MAG: hypothetical protein U0105_20730 [Candidatus Obscuribacterales bacterium]